MTMRRDAFVLLVRVWLRPGCEDEYLRLVRGVNDRMRLEPTFVNTILSRDADDPLHFIIHETWLDREDFETVQRKRPYRTEYETRLPDLVSRPREMQFFKLVQANFVFHTGTD